jgi:hypothetical protein
MNSSRFAVSVDDVSIIVQVPRIFRDKTWAEQIGAMQEQLQQVQHDSVTFDLTEVRWMDPFPTLSLVLEMSQLARRRKRVNVLLPVGDPVVAQNGDDVYSGGALQILQFMRDSGFLSCVTALGQRVRLIPERHKLEEQLLEYDSQLAYEQSLCIPMTYVAPTAAPRSHEEVARLIDDLTQPLRVHLGSRVPVHVQEGLQHRVRITLLELVQNSEVHAYPIGDDRHGVALYARYRTGGLNTARVSRNRYISALRHETQSCPRLLSGWLDARPGCVEVFVLDRGRGLVASFEQAGHKYRTKSYKFREAMEDTFVRGKSTARERETRYGGLHLLHNLMGAGADYVRAIEGRVWYGAQVPFDPRSQEQRHMLARTERVFSGLGVHARIGWHRDSDELADWTPLSGGSSFESVASELRTTASASESSAEWMNKALVVDERSGQETIYGSSGECMLWLVPRWQSKIDIVKKLEKKIAPKAERGSLLIIADIPSHEASTYAAALHCFRARPSQLWPQKFARIILATDTLQFTVVASKQYRDRWGFTGAQQRDRVIRNWKLLPRPENSRLGVLRWLKWHDSRVFWSIVERITGSYTDCNIVWQDDCAKQTVIRGYLDMASIAGLPGIRDVLGCTIRRASSLLRQYEMVVRPMDLVAEVLWGREVSDVVSAVRGREGTAALGLSSVYLSGSTQKQAAGVQQPCALLVHAGSPDAGSVVSFLHWLRDSEPVREVPRYHRIGKTGAIARHGWKSLEVPRFDRGGRCLAVRSPDGAYRDVQDEFHSIAKAGHWEYEDNHDYLTVNLAAAVAASFLAKGPLARFLVGNIVGLLGFASELLPGWEDVSADARVRDLCTASARRVVVYRSHATNDLVMQHVSEALDESRRTEFWKHVIPVVPLRRHSAGSPMLISPRYGEIIEGSTNVKPAAVVAGIFDDAAISGRTLGDLTASVRHMGIQRTVSIVIANRMRSISGARDSEDVVHYWRLDIPRMGVRGNCPLCTALELAEDLRPRLSSTTARDVLDSWCRDWRPAGPTRDWSAGLEPQKLPLVQKGFCYRCPPDGSGVGRYLSKIDLRMSIGNSLYVAELHAMAARSDYGLQVLDTVTVPAARIEIAITQIVLYFTELETATTLRLLDAIVEAATTLGEGSRHASLGVLVVMWAFRHLGRAERLEVASHFVEGARTSANYATKLLAAYFVSDGALKADCSVGESGMRLLSPGHVATHEGLRRVYRELLSERGNAHTEPLPLLYHHIDSGAAFHRNLIGDAHDSVELIEMLIMQMDVRDARKRSMEATLAAREGIVRHARVLRERLGGRIGGSELIEIAEGIRVFTKLVSDFVSGYVCIVHEPAQYYRQRVLDASVGEIVHGMDWASIASAKQMGDGETRCVRISCSGEISVPAAVSRLWILWDRVFVGAVRDLIANTIYVPSEWLMPDPWVSKGSSNVNTGTAHLWIRADLAADAAWVRMVCRAARTPSDIYASLKRNRWYRVTSEGGDVELDAELAPGLYGVQLRVPYVGK